MQKFHGSVQNFIAKILTLFHTIPTYNDLEKEAFYENIVAKGENTSNQHFSPFLTMFSTLPRTNFNVTVAFILLSANSFNFDQSKILLSGKDFKQLKM